MLSVLKLFVAYYLMYLMIVEIIWIYTPNLCFKMSRKLCLPEGSCMTSKVSLHGFLEDLEYENTMHIGPNFLHDLSWMHAIWPACLAIFGIVPVVKSCNGIWFFTLKWQLLNEYSTRMQLSSKKMYFIHVQ